MQIFRTCMPGWDLYSLRDLGHSPLMDVYDVYFYPHVCLGGICMIYRPLALLWLCGICMLLWYAYFFGWELYVTHDLLMFRGWGSKIVYMLDILHNLSIPAQTDFRWSRSWPVRRVKYFHFSLDSSKFFRRIHSVLALRYVFSLSK